MATSGTAFPSTLDAPLDATLSDDFVDPDHVNTADARARAVQSKVGADGDVRPATIDYRIRHLALAASTMTTAGDYVTLWSLTMADDTAVTVEVNTTAVRSGANEALGVGLTGTFRCKGGTAFLCGAVLTRHDQRTLLTTADVVLEVDGVNGVRLRVKSSLTDRVHWTARGTVTTARPGGM